MVVNNGIIICFGTDTTGRNRFDVILPVTYSSCLLPFVTTTQWNPNAPYSQCAKMISLSQINIDHWYNSGTGLTFSMCYMVIGF